MIDLSVIIPMHNAAPYIAATLDSLGGQTVPPREVLVVDDGSIDGSADIVTDYRFPDGSRPVLIRHEKPLGVAIARNRGAFHAKAEWVGFCDNDDLWHPRRIEMLSDAAASHPSAAGIATAATGFAAEADRELLAGHQRYGMVSHWVEKDDIAALTKALGPIEHLHERQITFADLQEATCFLTTSVIFPRETYAMAGGCAPWCHRADDWILNGCAALIGNILLLDAPLVLYRVRADSQSHAQSASVMALLAASLALRFGGKIVDRRPAAIFYEHVIRVAATDGMSFRKIAAFAVLGDLGLHRTGSLLKSRVRLSRRQTKRCAVPRSEVV